MSKKTPTDCCSTICASLDVLVKLIHEKFVLSERFVAIVEWN